MKNIVVSGLKTVMAVVDIVRNTWLRPGEELVSAAVMKNITGTEHVTSGQIA